jgi:Leucine-rich repeat (LRR) protein
LKSFYLSGNRLQEIPEAHLPLSLETLLLDRNRLEQQPDLNRLTKLKILNLSGNFFDLIDEEYLPLGLKADQVHF